MLQKIKKALSRFLNTRIGFILVVMVIMLSVVCVASEMEKGYDATLNIQYLFGDTIMRMFLENYIILAVALGIFLFLYAFLKNKLQEKKKIYWRIFVVGYIMAVLMILLVKPLHMNACYTIGDDSLNTAEALFSYAKDMIEDEYVTFQAENCEYKLETTAYIILGRVRAKHVEETFSYLYLYNQGDAIPIDHAYREIVEELVRESGGVCDITCYKNSHIIKTINGVELTSLR